MQLKIKDAQQSIDPYQKRWQALHDLAKQYRKMLGQPTKRVLDVEHTAASRRERFKLIPTTEKDRQQYRDMIADCEREIAGMKETTTQKHR